MKVKMTQSQPSTAGVIGRGRIAERRKQGGKGAMCRSVADSDEGALEEKEGKQ